MIRLRARVRRSIRITAITIIGLILAFPLIYLVLGSVMTSAQLTSFPPQFIPTSIHLGNYTLAWDYMRGRSVLNSVIFTVATVGLQWALCISAGFALAKLRFRSSNKVTALLGVSLFVPIITTLVPTFIVTDKFHLVNTYPGLILPIVAQTGFGTLLFRQYITGLPTELVDAARVDGTARGGPRQGCPPQRPQGVAGDPRGNPQRDRDVLGPAAGAHLRRTPGAGPLAQAHWRERRQRSRKIRRRWPGRRDHKPPGRPQILKMGTMLKEKLEKTLGTTQTCNC